MTKYTHALSRIISLLETPCCSTNKTEHKLSKEYQYTRCKSVCFIDVSHRPQLKDIPQRK